ncbi:SGNH/GDSL hydrolase family protein [Foetidibacter luteolus]|uniref:SGNH/GDSL hydrolase family protein n=1 Tax=Foetidibacter luteolus TaxID=2608880 RepID=UPI00129B213C|nr:SGNH/GDSL hydrolase family protein [Foetidibacter luteolus]
MKKLTTQTSSFFIKAARLVGSLILLLLATAAQAQTPSAFPPNTQRILFLGNSITYAGDYVADVEAWFAIHYPNWPVQFINAGLPSETVSGLSEPGHAGGSFARPDLHERLYRVLNLTKPDVVIACYGMNDGIYLPFDSARFKAFAAGINWLHDTLVKAGVKKIIHVTPPVHDDPLLGAGGYNKVLDAYAQWLLSLRALGWEVADIHFAMTEYLNGKRKTNPTYKLAEDGVHPGRHGHWLMAKAILQYLGEPVDTLYQAEQAFDQHETDSTIRKLVAERQAFMKDAWLTATGHKRPGMNAGMPLNEALQLYHAMEAAINKLRVK